MYPLIFCQLLLLYQVCFGRFAASRHENIICMCIGLNQLRLAKLLAEEWEKPYPVVMGFINARMSTALAS